MSFDDSTLVSIASALASLIVGAAVAIPRIMSGKKRDGLDKEFAEAQQKMLADMQELFQSQINALKEANEQQTQKISAMHSLIDKYRTQLTIVRNSLWEVMGALTNQNVILPQDTQERVMKVLRDEDNK